MVRFFDGTEVAILFHYSTYKLFNFLIKIALNKKGFLNIYYIFTFVKVLKSKHAIFYTITPIRVHVSKCKW